MDINNATELFTDSTLFTRWLKRLIKLTALLSVSGMVLYSCGSNSTGTNGGGNGGGNGGDPPEPTFSNVQQIFNGNCGGSGCHINQTTNGVRLDGYSNVTNSVGDQYGEEIVKPGDAAGSPLVDKIESNPEFGERMPLNGSPLSSDEINLIKAWINDGAKNN